jgi:phage I-like protein
MNVLADDGVAPARFLIFKRGKNATTKGDFLFDEESATSVMKAFVDHGNELVIDYEHQTASDPPVKAPAAGWFVPEVDEEGNLWATNVRWTKPAEEHIRSKEYRFTSPWFSTDEDGRVVKIRNVAITNFPATKSMQPLVAATDKSSDTAQYTNGGDMKEQIQQIIAMLTKMAEGDMAPAEGETEMMKKVRALFGGEAAPSEDEEQIVATSGVVADLASITGKTDPAEIRGVLASWKAESARASRLSARVAELEKTQAEAEFDRLVEEGKTAKKFTPVMLSSAEFAEMRASATAGGTKQLRTMLKLLGPAVASEEESPQPTNVAVSLTAEEIGYAKKMGIPVKDLAEHKAKRHARDNEGVI